MVVGVPVRERGDEADGVEALSLPVGHGLLEADAGGRDVVRRGPDTPPRQPPRRGREPGVAHQEERRAVRVLQCVPVRRRPDEAPAVSVLPLLVLGPRHRTEPTAAAVQPGVVGLTRARPPAPLARRRRDEPDLEGAPAVPEAVHAAGEARSLELDPALHVGVGVGVALRRLEGDLLRLPDVDFAGRERGPGGGDAADADEGERHEAGGESGHGGGPSVVERSRSAADLLRTMAKISFTASRACFLLHGATGRTADTRDGPGVGEGLVRSATVAGTVCGRASGARDRSTRPVTPKSW